MGASGAKRQADAIRYAADKASSTALTLNDRSRADLKPYNEVGQAATTSLLDILQGKQSIGDYMKTSPMFQWQSDIGQRNIERQLVAQGLQGSGAGLAELVQFNAQLSATEGENYFGHLTDLSHTGEAAAAQQANNTTATGNTIAGIQANAGANEDAALANQYNSLGDIGLGLEDAFKSGVSNYTNYRLYKTILDRLAGGGTAPGSVAPVGVGRAIYDDSADSVFS
jgi:hypothetical protein